MKFKQQQFQQNKFAFGLTKFDQQQKTLNECVSTFLKIYQFELKGNQVKLIHPEDENLYTCRLETGRKTTGKLFSRLTVLSCERLKYKAKESTYSYKQKYADGYVFDLLAWMIADISMMNHLRKLKQFGKEKQTGALHGIYAI